MQKVVDIKINTYMPGGSDEPVSYNCAECRDTGWISTERGMVPCPCRDVEIKLRRQLACGLTPVLAQKIFESFDITFYEEYLKTEKGKTFRGQAQKIFDACRSYAENFKPGESTRGILLRGDVGRGKTYLAAAICNALLERGIMSYFLIVPEFLDEIRASYGSSGEFSEMKLMNKAMQTPFLVLDDLGSHNFSAWTIDKLFTLINYRVNHGLPFVITTNLTISELQSMLGERIISRIAEACDFYCLQSGNDIRMLLNMKKAEAETEA